MTVSEACHPLVLHKAEDYKRSYGQCQRCFLSTPTTGPFYRCEKGDNYYLHKVCAELPNEMNHPLHPQHTLHLQTSHDYDHCAICSESHVSASYSCDGTCAYKFAIDLKCASASHTIEDKCHMHPLIPIMIPTDFYCHICRIKVNDISYKCAICPYWIHQNCILLPTTVKHSDHEDLLTLLHSIPIEYYETLQNCVCGICYGNLGKFETIYSCVECLFFAHASCATSLENQSSRYFRNVNNRVEDDGDHLLLPLRKEQKISLISLFVEKYKSTNDIDALEIYHFSHNHPLHLRDEREENICEACSQIILGTSYHCAPCNFYLHKFCTKLPDPCNSLKAKIRHFSHEHPLYFLDAQVNENLCGRVCNACSESIADSSYGCTQCDYFLHKCCIELPRKFLNPLFEHDEWELFAQYPNKKVGIFNCSFCAQNCNGFFYSSTTFDGDLIIVDIKCTSLPEDIKHESHKHELYRSLFGKCSFCTKVPEYGFRCRSCSFRLCSYCIMLPPVINHRYCRHGLRLHYSHIKNYDRDYICDLCEETLQPQRWFYHCGDCEQFAHPTCLMDNAGDSNIKYGKHFSLPDHEHKLTLTSFTHVRTPCKVCHNSLNYGYAVGFKCSTCDFKIHLNCLKSEKVLRRGMLEDLRDEVQA